jgi:hypothetical protein
MWPQTATVETLLEQVRNPLDEPISSDMERKLIEVLVAGIRVDTIEEHGVSSRGSRSPIG